MDPNVQVAFVGVLGILITTAGGFATAALLHRRENAKSAEAGYEAGLDEKNVLKRMLYLIADNDRKETVIQDQNRLIDEQRRTIDDQQSELQRLRSRLAKEGGEANDGTVTHKRRSRNKDA